VKRPRIARRFRWKRHPQVAEEPLLDTPEKRSELLKQIAAGIATKPGPLPPF
jgi:hypothetical protein